MEKKLWSLFFLRKLSKKKRIFLKKFQFIYSQDARADGSAHRPMTQTYDVLKGNSDR